MKTIEQLERWKKINEFLKQENSGGPEEFSQKLGISLSHFFRCIEELKALGVPIKFDRVRKTYYYEFDFELKVSYSVQLLTKDDLITIFGGNCIKNSSLLFFESARA